MAPGKQPMISSFLAKMKDPDVDFRFMALSDLTNAAIEDSALFGTDESLEARTVGEVLRLVEDKNSEVKNQAVKCLGQLVKCIREAQMNTAVDSLIDFIGGKDDELRDIAGLALKTVTSEIPQEGKIAEKTCSKLGPKLLVQVGKPDTPPETAIEMLSILSILVTRFSIYLADIHPSPIATLTPLLGHPRTAVRKRAVVALAQFLPTASQQLFDNLWETTINPALELKAPIDHQKIIVSICPQRIGPVLQSIVPPITNISSRDDVELREASLQSLETLILRCPSEITPYLQGIISVANSLVKYDPNYAAEDNEDEEMQDVEDDENGDDLGDAYSDEEETSYKVRRSATKLLAAIIGTRPDMLLTVYRDVSPVLISRFGDREETVRLELWSTYTLLLRQTEVHGAAIQTRDSETHVSLKRKRGEGMDVEETPTSLLKAQTSAICNALIKQIHSKASALCLQTGFTLFRALLKINPGCLSAQTPAITQIVSFTLKRPPGNTSSALHVSVLGFLDLYFSTHSPAVFNTALSALSQPLVSALSERDPRISAAAFRCFATLLVSLKPLRPNDWSESLYTKVLEKLERNDTDISVRELAEVCLAELWVCAPDVVRGKSGAEWAALRRFGRAEGAINVVKTVAERVNMTELWTGESIEWALGIIRKGSRTQRDDAFVCLRVLLSKYENGYPPGLASSVMAQIIPHLTLAELSHFTNSVSVITQMLRTSPRSVYGPVEKDVLPLIYPSVVSPAVTATLLDALLDFLAALVHADSPIASRVVQGLLNHINASTGSTPAINSSKCIAVAVRGEHSLAVSTIQDFARSIKSGSQTKDARLVLSLHVLGEIGRFVDMSSQKDVFSDALNLFSSDSQDIRTAAAFTVGNVAIGNIPAFLPVIIKQIQADDERRLLSLHSLKEIVTHCSNSQLEGVADAVWSPVFENPENSEEGTRNVAAACLGKLTTTNPSRYLPQLQSRIRDPSWVVRATVVSSIRYTFVDTSESYDELLSPLVVDFLSLVQDYDLTVRRLSLTALNAAARNKPKLIREHLASIMPLLYHETKINENLIRIVEMGPWKHRVDDGLETRKVAFETMYTILDTCVSNLDLHQFFTHVLEGLADESDEIKVLCHMMLFRLSQVAPTTVQQRLDEVSPELEETIKGAQVTKDTVKQDLERAGELQRSALRAIAALSRLSSPTVSPRMERLVESIEKGRMAKEFRELL
ncbi:TIP120-domain-containing protein [Cantharellus anzutake]|uniref:TIP120-domain-containing protein n=1 Tax=Cantharellus anzutake TaxID=1750568 RepID=UPI001904CD96|nr:TIP120-domain-containing protein [Cantharellus anzutake]KAF8329094.1 TIP120-domain-containing protein [Cantharellus anzutake]